MEYKQRLIGLAMAVVAVAVVVASIAAAGTPNRVRAEEPWALLPTCGNPGVQFLGQSEALNKSAFESVDVKELSGIAFDRGRGVYYTHNDRIDPGIPNRYFTLDLPVYADSIGSPVIQDATYLLAADGSISTGSEFDPEGIALSHAGQLFIAGEARVSSGVLAFQTEVRQYDLDGTMLASLPVPSRFLVGGGGQGVSNLNFESMALSPSGRYLFTANETPLTGDDVTADSRARIRILSYEDFGEGGFLPAGEFFYLTEAARPSTPPLEVGVVEIIALSDVDLLVMERGFVSGLGNTVRIFQVSLVGAEDVSDEPALGTAGLVPLAKSLVVDLVNCPSGGATLPPGATQPNPLLDNFEAMTLGPELPGGRRALVLVSDDNNRASQTTRIVVLAVTQQALVGQD